MWEQFKDQVRDSSCDVLDGGQWACVYLGSWGCKSSW